MKTALSTLLSLYLLFYFTNDVQSKDCISREICVGHYSHVVLTGCKGVYDVEVLNDNIERTKIRITKGKHGYHLYFKYDVLYKIEPIVVADVKKSNVSGSKNASLADGKYKVSKVIDGDTIDVSNGKQSFRIRLYGIDTPEKNQWYGQNAKTFTETQVGGKTVTIKGMDVDRYGRIVAMVYIGNVALNRHLIEHGYAWVYDTYCKDPICQEWKVLEKRAQNAKRGLWKNPKSIPPWEYRKAEDNQSKTTPVPTGSTKGPCDCSGDLYNCPDFKSPAEAQKCYNHCLKETGRDVHKLDRDGDGKACEK